MVSRVRTASLNGVEAIGVDVEVEVRAGKRLIVIVGLGDSAVQESGDRVFAALDHSGFGVSQSVLANLAPAEVRKTGASFDLPLAIGILAASRQLSSDSLKGKFCFGELSLTGSVKGVRGIVPFTIEAVRRRATEVIVPWNNFHEASLIRGVKVVPVRSLIDAVRYLREGHYETPSQSSAQSEEQPKNRVTFDGVIGQDLAKRALTIAAAGGHNVLFVGPPGCGKSLLASAFPSILPPLLEEEILDVARIHSSAGLSIESILRGERPFRSPHHVVSDVGLIGGGPNPRPGEVSLAHRGVLFLDEFPEYRRSAIEALRGPLESGSVTITRARASARFPAMFQLIAAMNPCPCGRLGVRGAHCICSQQGIRSYLKKLSQPILDRIDLHVELDAVPVEDLFNRRERSRIISETDLPGRVAKTHELQMSERGVLNSRMSGDELFEIVPRQSAAIRLLERAAASHGLSARSYVRILRVAKTIADFAGESVRDEHVAEALSFRLLERWMGEASGGASNLQVTG